MATPCDLFRTCSAPGFAERNERCELQQHPVKRDAGGASCRSRCDRPWGPVGPGSRMASVSTVSAFAPPPGNLGGRLAGSGVKFRAAVLFHAVLCCCVRSGISIHIASVVSVAVDQSRSDVWADALAFLGGMHYVFHWE